MDASAKERGGWGRLVADARWLQVAFLATLLAFVLAFRDFTPSALQVGLTILVAVGGQALLVRMLGLPSPGPLSPLITALSLGLLLRSNAWWIPPAAAAVAVASKYAVRIGGKHVFNPSNLAIVVMLLLTRDAWVSPSQWGNGILLAFFLAGLGLAVTTAAGRADITLAFLAAHLGLKLLRVLWLGQRPEVFAHQALSGALVLFAFFMISDPRATPDARLGRIVFAVLVAVVAHVLQFGLFWNDALLWALVLVSPLTPILDRLLPGARFEWTAPAPGEHAHDTWSRLPSAAPG